jgi:hypothetical protein
MIMVMVATVATVAMLVRVPMLLVMRSRMMRSMRMRVHFAFVLVSAMSALVIALVLMHPVRIKSG